MKSVLSLLAAALIGAGLANLGSAAAEPQPAWDRDLTRQLIRAQEAQREALEASVRLQEQQVRALQELGRSVEHAADRCRH
jgi:hypothetical protein